MALILLFALYVALSGAAVFHLWRRAMTMSGELTQLRRQLSATVGAVRRTRRVEGAAVAPIDDGELYDPTAVADEGPLARAARAWGLDADAVNFGWRGPTISPQTARGLTLAALATLPALGFFFRADPALIVAIGLTIGAAMMMIALRALWRVAAWAGVLTAGAWAVVGFAMGAAHADPIAYGAAVALAGVAGLTYAHLQRATQGATMALAMSAAVLALGSQIGMIGAAGAAFGVIVAAGAIVGAISLRLEAIHLAAFGAAVIGLFVLSGQDSAAIWFTPAAAWTGAVFFAIAAVRVPRLGPRGVALAGTGAFAPLGVITALHAAQQGLANNLAAAGAYLVLALLLAGLIAVSAFRRPGGLEALRLTLWVLALAAFGAAAAAISLALPPQLAAPAFAAFGLGLSALDLRLRNIAWRTFAVAAGIGAVVCAAGSADVLLTEATQWAPWLVIAAGIGLPALIAGGAAIVFARAEAPATSACFEAIALVLAVAAANLLARLLFAEGAMLLRPIGFVEAGVHSAIWLTAALLIGSRASLGASGVRTAAINALAFAALVLMLAAAALWTTPFWSQRESAGSLRDTLGFLIPAILFWAHWVFWRARSDDLQTRLALGAGALLFAAFLTVEALRMQNWPDWAGALTGAVSFALALGINFAPGVTNEAPRRVRPRDRSPSRSARQATR